MTSCRVSQESREAADEFASARCPTSPDRPSWWRAPDWIFTYVASLETAVRPNLEGRLAFSMQDIRQYARVNTFLSVREEHEPL